MLATVSGHRVVELRLLVGNTGPWTAECDLEGDDAVSGSVTLEIAGGDAPLRLQGTVTESGVFGEQRKLRIVAGAGAWGNVVTAKGYHNDAGVKALLVATDAAREVGERLGSFAPAADRLGADYARHAGVASRALEDAAGSLAWWVDHDGVTHVGGRPAGAQVDPDVVHVLEFDPRCLVATLAVDDMRALQIGSVLSDRLEAPQTVREFELHITPDSARVTAWCGGGASETGHLVGLLRAIAQRATDERLTGLYRYRVGGMQGDRVLLQIVRRAAGLPDLLPVSMWPGVAGVHALLTPGAEVLVQFVEGLRTQPVITHFAGKDGVGFVPISLTIGGPVGLPAARQTDPVQVTLPPASFSGTIGGSPATGTVVWAPPAIASGTIVGGSAKVSIA